MTAPDQASPAGQETPPTCYRHPDRETWVSCVRCGRHACPDCLRQAAVGQQCVECVRGAGQRQPRTAFGGRLVTNAAVTWTLVGINVLVFLIEVANPNLMYELAMVGAPVNTREGCPNNIEVVFTTEPQALLDDVRVIQIPEPSSLALISACICLGWRLNRRIARSRSFAQRE